jgi:hypothetical protein
MNEKRLAPLIEIRRHFFRITVEAFEAICATLPLGSVAYEGERLIWLERKYADQLDAMRGPESFSDVALRLAAVEHE